MEWAENGVWDLLSAFSVRFSLSDSVPTPAFTHLKTPLNLIAPTTISNCKVSQSSCHAHHASSLTICGSGLLLCTSDPVFMLS